MKSRLAVNIIIFLVAIYTALIFATLVIEDIMQDTDP